MADAPAKEERKSSLGSIFMAAKEIALMKLEETLAAEREKLKQEQRKAGTTDDANIACNDEIAADSEVIMKEEVMESSASTPNAEIEEPKTNSTGTNPKDEEAAKTAEDDSIPAPIADETENILSGTLEKDGKQPSFSYLLSAAKMLASKIDQTTRSIGASMDEDDDDSSTSSSEGDDDGEMKPVQSTNLADAKAKADAANPTKSLFEGLAGNFMKVVAGSDKTQDDKDRTISAIVSSVCEQTDSGTPQEGSSIKEIMDMMGKYKGKLGEVAQKFMGDIDFRKMSPTAVAYFLEHQDEQKNPSWKRRSHRFCPSVSTDTIHELNDALFLSLLSYADTAEEIREGLDGFKTPYELAACTVLSNPGEPAHFVAVKRDQKSNSKYKKMSSSLKVVIGVRGTKSAADAITDLLCDTAEYRGGKAHAMILKAGKYIAEKHIELLDRLRETAGKKTVKITLIGHSLGAGAASIAGMEIKAMEHPKMIVKQVIGFGCPALVSEELAEEASSFITTVVNDSDVVPRMSGVSVANLLLDIMAFDWFSYAETDLHNALFELRKRHSFLIRDSTVTRIEQAVLPLLKNHMESTIIPKRTERLTPEVYPPGNCIHFYHDGRGVSASYVPNTFFAEVDVTRRMIDGYQQTLLEIARQRAVDHHFRFD